MKKIITFSAILVLLISSCSKRPMKVPEPEITNPEFYINCNMDGQPLNLAAGNEEYYMYSSWYHMDTAKLYVYKANLSKLTGTGYQVTILINDSKLTSAGDAMNVENAATLGEHLYNDLNTAGLTQNINFEHTKALNQSSMYEWLITDGVNPARHYGGGPDGDGFSISPLFDVGTTYSVTLQYTDGGGTCTSTLTNVFKAGTNLYTTVSAVRQNDFNYKLSYTAPVYNSSFECLWTFPDSTTDTQFVTQKNFSPGTTSVVSLRLKDKISGETCMSYYQLNATTGAPCDANYTAHYLPIQNTRLYSSVTILLTDPNGVVYSSQGLIQPSSSNFEVQNLENYDINEKRESTKRLKVKFNCIVKNGSNTIHLTDGEARIAVSYK